MIRPRPTRRRAAFTLIELVISTALMALILAAAYACLSAGFAGRKLVEPRTEIFQTARVVLGFLSADLRCACPLPRGAPFLGVHRQLGNATADNLDFATHNYTPRRPGEGDFCEESIFLEREPRTGSLTLWRRRNPTLAFDPLSGGRREQLATGIAGIRLEYYDGFEWYDSWGDPNAGSLKSQVATPKPNSIGLPEAVRLTLLFESEPHRVPPPGNEVSKTAPPLAFQTVVRLNLPTVSPSPPSGEASTPPGSP